MKLQIVAFATCLACTQAFAQRPPAVVPTDPQTVIERLPRGYAALMPRPATTSIATATTREPVSRIRQLLAAAAQTGDARLTTRADAMLARIPTPSMDADVLVLRAFSAQHRHDFASAVASLDQAIARSPRNATARLSRAQVQVVRGRLDRARGDCTALVLGIDSGSGLLCVGMLSLRTERYTAAAAALDRWLQAGSGGIEARRYALVMRGEVAARAGDRDADAWFRQAMALAPDDVRTLAAYARFLRHAGRDREVDPLLAAHAGHDGLHLQRTLAAYRLDPEAAAPLVASQARRFAAAHAAGSPRELRDEAEFLLVVRRDRIRALALARENFGSQRDYEDVGLLRRAASAAHRPDVLQELESWEESQGLSPASRQGRAPR